MGDRRQLIEQDESQQEYEGSRTDLGRASTEDSTNNETTQVSEPTKYTSQLAAMLITVNVTIGAGLLALPFEMQESGLVTSIVIQIIFLLSVITTCIMCTELTVKTNVNSYDQVVKAHCHPYLYRFTQMSILLMVFGTAVAFLVIIGDQSDRFFATVYGHSSCYNNWYMNRRFVIIILTQIFIKPLCCAKTVDFLKYASFLGVASIGFITYVVVSEFSHEYTKNGHIARDVNYLPKHWTDAGSILPVFCLAYQVHLSWIPTAASIRKEEKYTTYKTVTVSMVVATIIYVTVCVFALFTFGSKIENDLTESYPEKTTPVIATVAIVAIKCVLTMAPAFLPARLTLIDVLSKLSSRFAAFKEPTKRISVTVVTLNLALFLALVVPDILMAVDLLGCLSVMFVFTLPALCYLNLVRENRRLKQQLASMDTSILVYTMKDKFKLAISYFFIVFGLAMTMLVLYKAVDGIAHKVSSPPICYP